MMLTISQLAQQFGLSRSTLLHYDRIGLLCPSYRTYSNYRLYNAAEIERLAQICKYRRAGLSLERIATILDSEAGEEPVREALKAQLEQLAETIEQARRQQQLILGLLQKADNSAPYAMDKAQWVELLKDSGMDEADLQDWHRLFEAQNPEAHQCFLQGLGIPLEEVKRIRAWAQKSAAPQK